MNTIDPLKLQRLVDGELDTPEIQDMLANAQANSDQWKEIAIGFVEDQVWRRTIQGNEYLAEASFHESQTTEKVVAKDVSSTKLHPSWLAIAAGVMLAAAAWFAFEQFQDPGNPGENLIVTRQPTLPAGDSPLEQTPSLAANNTTDSPGFTKADYHFELPEDANKQYGVTTSDKVPLYAIDNQEQFNQFTKLQKEHGLPADLVQRLRGSGFQMTRDIEFISGRMGDGRSFVVPVQTIRFLPGQ